ncbi:MAG: phenylalanine--tRNA ligase beta subunit-related protein, partial [Gaiellaceae bacterium]
AMLDKQLAVSPYSFKKFDWKEKIANSSTLTSIEDNCSTFIAMTVENLTNISVPKWLKEKLIYSGFTPLNNLLDFQNYILLETGYPFAFYDYAKICSTLNCSELNFSVTPGRNSTEFLAANNSTYQLDNSVLVVEINETPISIGGLIESNEFAYSETTSSLIIEASIFDAAKIRQQSRNLGLRTDRSARYEKSLKNSYLNEALYKLISLLRISNPNLNCKFRTIFQKKEELSKPLILRHQTIKEILGPVETSSQINRKYIRAEEITDYLKRLQFTFSYDEVASLWKVEIPHSRSDDLTREIDLVEEIGRLHGFNHFLITLPKIKIIGNEDSSYKTRKKITSCLLNLGLSELIHYSLASEKEFLTNDIKLINPLLSDSSNLRSSLLPDLVKTMQGNVKQGNLIVEGFEYGHIFSTSEGESFQ